MSIKQNTNNFAERRKHPRINTVNIVNYILFNDHPKKIGHGKGRVLNLSKNGALLEANKPLSGSFVILTAIGMNGEKIRIKGRMANTRETNKTGLHLTGIEFIGSKEEQLSAIISLVKNYNYWKYAANKLQRHSSALLV